MSQVISEKKGAVGHVILSNVAKMNAMTMHMWQAVPLALQTFDKDPEIRVIVISGDGDKAFISGADISQFDHTDFGGRSHRFSGELITRIRERFH